MGFVAVLLRHESHTRSNLHGSAEMRLPGRFSSLSSGHAEKPAEFDEISAARVGSTRARFPCKCFGFVLRRFALIEPLLAKIALGAKGKNPRKLRFDT